MTITGVSGTLTHTISVTLVVTAPAPSNFSLTASPDSQTVSPGDKTHYDVKIFRSEGFTKGVTLSVSGLPSGATASFRENPASGKSSRLRVNTDAAIPSGTYLLTIIGKSGTIIRTTSVSQVDWP